MDRPEDQPGGIAMAPHVLLSMAGLLTLSVCAALALGAAVAPTFSSQIRLDDQHKLTIYLGPANSSFAPEAAYQASPQGTLREFQINYQTPELYHTLVQLTWRKFNRVPPPGSQPP
jgi:hypothetical protein